jgi:hypothetical protein
VRQKKIIPVNFFLNHSNELGKLLAALSPSRPRKPLRLSHHGMLFASREADATSVPPVLGAFSGLQTTTLEPDRSEKHPKAASL